jgi:hypothetical protein
MHSEPPAGIDEEELSLALQDEFSLAPSGDNQRKYEAVLKNVLPCLGSNEGKIILAQVLIALKIEGIIGKELSFRDTKMVKAIKESIMVFPDKKKQALRYAQRLLNTGE